MNRDCNSRISPMRVPNVDRRTMLAGTAALSAWPSQAFAQSASLPFSDAHGHFFNASDLPIAGFAKYTLMPEWLGQNPAVGALVDFLAFFVKPAARTAQWEAEHLSEGEEWGYLKFGREAGRFVYERQRSALKADLDAQGITQTQLSSSYDALRAALFADANYPVDQVPSLLRSKGNEAALNEIIFAEVARKVDEESAWDAGEVAERNTTSSLLDPTTASQALIFGRIARVVAWGYLMLKRRESHLKEYVSRNGATGFAPNVLVNHLVDYDYWIDDCPAKQSSHKDQIEFWNAIATKAKSWPRAVDVRTFAGFCPLKLAIEKRASRPLLFDSLKQAHRDGKIAGFKLYPPMGFQPLDNSKLDDNDFDSGGIFRVSALDQWRKVGGKQERLGPWLDKALFDFYDYCAANNAPIMAHARRSTDSGPDYRERAHPRFWERVIADRPLRLQLGHLIENADKFVRSAEGAAQDGSWPLDATIRMLRNPNFTSGAQVYGDLGYMPDLLRNPRLAENFFRKLRSVFGDAGLKRISYGTDWIMLAQEKHDREYLAAINRGMADAEYTSEQRRDILENNLRRFLGG